MEQNKTEQALRSLIDLGCTVEDIMEAASKIEEEQNQQPTDRLHDTALDIRERIKTFEDAQHYLGEDNKFVEAQLLIEQTMDDCPDIQAYAKLRVIAAALNEEPEGWRPKYPDENGNGGERRWAPYFRAVFFGGYADYGAYDGLSCASADYDFTYADASYGSRLCYKSEELAEYSGNQFKDIWEDLILR